MSAWTGKMGAAVREAEEVSCENALLDRLLAQLREDNLVVFEECPEVGPEGDMTAAFELL